MEIKRTILHGRNWIWNNHMAHLVDADKKSSIFVPYPAHISIAIEKWIDENYRGV